MYLRILVLLFITTFAAQAAFQAGIAVRVVTPDPLLPVSGGLGPTKAADRKQGELTVRALVLENQGQRVAFLSVDFLGFPSVLGDRIRQRVKAIPADHILIGATHTHSAPDVYAFPDGKGGTTADLKYLDRVVEQAAAAVNEAVGSLQPAALRVASGEAKGAIAYNYYAPDLYDPRVNILQILDSKAQPIATLVNYAIHPEVIGSSQGICSPDLIGPLYDRLKERGGGVGIFLNSAQGGMVTADNRRPNGTEVNDWSECQRIGNLLADEALRLVASAPVQKDTALHVAAETVVFPVDSGPLLAIMKGSPLGYAADAEGRISTTVNLVNLGTAQILTIPGEALPNIGYYLKRKMRGQQNFLFGLTNDAFGYILTEIDWNSFKRYDYISRTCLGERTGQIFIDAALKLIAAQPAP